MAFLLSGFLNIISNTNQHKDVIAKPRRVGHFHSTE